MTPADAGRILAVAGTLDAKHTPPSKEDGHARALAWAAALNPEIDVTWAVRHVAAHYAESTETLMPAHLNVAWKAHIRPIREEEERRRLLESPGVPMPDFVKEKMRQLMAKTETL